MGMPEQDTEWTAEMVRALPDDGQRYEVLDGELFVSPAPRPDHQSVLQRLFVILDDYVRKHELGWVFMSPADLEFSPRRYVQPDLFVVRNIGQADRVPGRQRRCPWW
jgi:Uma2 family endonuclease